MISIIIGKSAGEQKILHNRGMLGDEVSPALLDRIAKTMGERLTPEQAVARIIADIRTRGDVALLELSDSAERLFQLSQ